MITFEERKNEWHFACLIKTWIVNTKSSGRPPLLNDNFHSCAIFLRIDRKFKWLIQVVAVLSFLDERRGSCTTWIHASESRSYKFSLLPVVFLCFGGCVFLSFVCIFYFHCVLCVIEMFTFIFVNSATMTLSPYIITMCVNVRALSFTATVDSITKSCFFFSFFPICFFPSRSHFYSGLYSMCVCLYVSLSIIRCHDIPQMT